MTWHQSKPQSGVVVDDAECVVAVFANDSDAARAVRAVNAGTASSSSDFPDLRDCTASPSVWAALSDARQDLNEIVDHMENAGMSVGVWPTARLVQELVRQRDEARASLGKQLSEVVEILDRSDVKAGTIQQRVQELVASRAEQIKERERLLLLCAHIRRSVNDADEDLQTVKLAAAVDILIADRNNASRGSSKLRKELDAEREKREELHRQLLDVLAIEVIEP